MAAAAFLVLVPQDAQAQCLKCTTKISEDGELSCNVDQTSSGYYECSCPCECTGACNQFATVEYEELDSHQLPPAGVPVVGVPDDLPVAGTLGVAVNATFTADAYFRNGLGFVRYSDATWRAFPLESGNSFVVRNCRGKFLARIAAASAGE